jgi:hypothetical protein
MYVMSTNLIRLLYPLAIAIDKANGYTQPRNLATGGIPSSLQPLSTLPVTACFVCGELSFIFAIYLAHGGIC